MIDLFISNLGSMPNELIVFLVSMLPIGELRVGLPLALTLYDMQLLPAMFYSIAGNMVPALIIYFLIGPFSRLLSKIDIFDKFFNWLFERTRKKFSAKKYAKYEFIALILFVGIPLPMTGAWTGAVAAWLFGMKPRYAITGFLLGLIMSAVIVAILTLGVSNGYTALN